MSEEQTTVKLPNALTLGELMGEGKTTSEAKRIMADRVFGVGHSHDEEGKPVEQGLGSPANPTPQHKEALRLATERKAFSQPNNAEVIAAAVAAGVKAGLAAAREENL